MDGKAFRRHSTGRRIKGKGRMSDPDADWGVHSHRGVDRRTGKARARPSRWSSYKLHLIADTKHELPVAFSVERASGCGRPAPFAGGAKPDQSSNDTSLQH